MSGWPLAWDELVEEARSGRGRPVLVDSTGDTGRLFDAIAPRFDLTVSLGSAVARAETLADFERALLWPPGSLLLVDLDILFAPQLAVDVVAMLRRRSQLGLVVAAWPGQIEGGRVTYSLAGRPDHVDEPARGLVVLRPVSTHFPDEVPYTVERYPA